ncbi:MAG: hemerythrin domain-containing protein [Rhodocyclales bacterium]|nr:hemerythrin domain-containing protein [Rhodocyclales bacterium]
MKSIDIIHSEHRALASVLQALRFVVGEIGAGRLQPDFRLLSSMVDYITQVPDKVHHPKEDDHLFPALRARSTAAAGLIDALEAQHAEGYRMTVGLLQALVHYQAMGDKAFANFEATVLEYLAFSWKHLNMEEGELLPLARKNLTADDWTAIDAAFAANFDPCAGAQGEFEVLFGCIVSMTPAPYGLGTAR